MVDPQGWTARGSIQSLRPSMAVSQQREEMQTKQEIQNTTSVIISFTDSYAQNKQGKQNEQPESESLPPLSEVGSTLLSLRNQIEMNKSYKQVILIPKLLQSLVALSFYKIGNHIDLEVDQQRIDVRSWSRACLSWIQSFGDEQVQQELVRQGYGRVMSLSFCTSGGVGEEQDAEIRDGLYRISRFLNQLHEGRNYPQPSFQPLPLLVRSTEVQIEEEGAIEEIDAQMKN
ncbi:MAG: hypothetical protein EZS28_041720, partial [Streblomastix strix]